MLEAVKKIPINAKITASGSAPPASGEPNGIEAAIAAAGAIEQIDWKTTRVVQPHYVLVVPKLNLFVAFQSFL
jgi:hypothetical protein